MSATTCVVRSSCRGCHGVCQVLVHLEGVVRKATVVLLTMLVLSLDILSEYL